MYEDMSVYGHNAIAITPETTLAGIMSFFFNIDLCHRVEQSLGKDHSLAYFKRCPVSTSPHQMERDTIQLSENHRASEKIHDGFSDMYQSESNEKIMTQGAQHLEESIQEMNVN